jgi:hypothetical protein
VPPAAAAATSLFITPDARISHGNSHYASAKSTPKAAGDHEIPACDAGISGFSTFVGQRGR